MQKRMENYSALVTHQPFLCFSRTPEFIEFEAINSDGISSSLLVILLHGSGPQESQKTQRGGKCFVWKTREENAECTRQG